MLLSDEQKEYIKKTKRKNKIILFFQIMIFIMFIFLWEISANLNLINSFLTSSPSKIIETLINLYKNNNLFNHIWITFYETMYSFLLSIIIGLIVSSILWWNKMLAKIIEPYLTIINSLPKIALGPIIIIWIGANTNSIIFMALLICIIINIITIYEGFNNIDYNKIKLLKSFNASKLQIYYHLILKGNIKTIISSLKINISMCLIGVIMGELLVSKEGIGYLITYGSQVFNINLVMTGVFILIIFSYILYYFVSFIEKITTSNK